MNFATLLRKSWLVRRLPLILIVACSWQVGEGSAGASFSSTQQSPHCGSLNFTGGGYGVNSRPFALATGDFDGDGKLDLASANYFSGSTSDNIALLFGNGKGNFVRFASYQFGALPSAIATGDFNHDGKLDLVVCHSGSNVVTLLFNDGTGAFPRGSAFAINNPRSVAVGDFNGDGALDLAVTEFGSSYLWVIPVSREGGFQAAERYIVGQDPISVVTGDFNRDGKLDLATANFSANTISVLNNRGNGKFDAAINYAVGGAPESLAVGDFNADGKADLAVAQSGTTSVAAFINTTMCEPVIPTFAVVFSSPNPSKVGQSVSLRCNMYAAAGREVPTGQVQFLEHGLALSPWLPLAVAPATLKKKLLERKGNLVWKCRRPSINDVRCVPIWINRSSTPSLKHCWARRSTRPAP